MLRFHGTFEGKKVTAKEYRELENIRLEEADLVEYYKTEFEMEIEDLEYWRENEIDTLECDAADEIYSKERAIDTAYYKIEDIRQRLIESLHIIDQYFPNPSAEKDYQIDFVNSLAQEQIDEQYDIIDSCCDIIQGITDQLWDDIDNIEDEFDSEYAYLLEQRDKDIARAHTDATELIEEILSRFYEAEPILVVRCAYNPCDFCAAKYGTTGTYAQLQALHCIPPFHKDCRCWLAVVHPPDHYP